MKIPKKDRNFVGLFKGYTLDSRYLDFGYLEQPLISKKKSGPCLNIEIWYQVTKNCG